ncbi:MAG: hypothetical protein V1647_00020 [Pseudomonadota bacterium]
MARAFADAVRAGRMAYLAKLGIKSDYANASTPVVGIPNVQ